MSLYTNIPPGRGIKAISELLNLKWKNSLPINDNLIKILEMVLKYNNFSFNGENILQMNGTAISILVAPTYLNIFVDHIERKHIHSHERCPMIWFRYIDDICGIFRGSEEELKEFLELCNSINEAIKCIIEYSKERVSFLDVITYSENNTIKSMISVKPHG